jgi:chemotaxis protein methyltransferase CheR
MERLGIARADEYLVRLREEPRLLDELVDDLVVGETYFFREREALEFVMDVVFPSVAAGRDEGQTLKVWSAGCASGEEPYSLAIMTHDSQYSGRVRILGTDISRGALAKAGKGAYSTWALRATPAETTARCFRHSGGRYTLAERYRRAVEFRYLNLAADTYPDLLSGTAGVDVILCRNVLMYFPREVVARVADGFFRSLAPGGWLVTGASDPPLGSFAPFEAVVCEVGVFYRRPDDQPAPGAGPGVRGKSTGRFEARVGTAGPVEAWNPGEPAGRLEALELPGLEAGDGAARGQRDGAVRCPVVDGVRTGSTSPAMEEAHRLFREGEIGRVLAMLEAVPTTADSALLRVRVLANLGRPEEAESFVRKALAALPQWPEGRFVLAMLLFQRGNADEALAELRRTLYLDHQAAVAHFFNGVVLQKSGKRKGALRAFRNAHRLAAAEPPESVLAYSEGQLAGNLAEAAAAQVAVLERMQEESR